MDHGEQNAVKVAIRGIAAWQQTLQEPKPMRVVVTPANPFNIKAFANTLHGLGINISSSIQGKAIGDQVEITFQPKPYEKSSFTSPLDPVQKLLYRMRNFAGFPSPTI